MSDTSFTYGECLFSKSCGHWTAKSTATLDCSCGQLKPSHKLLVSASIRGTSEAYCNYFVSLRNCRVYVSSLRHDAVNSIVVGYLTELSTRGHNLFRSECDLYVESLASITQFSRLNGKTARIDTQAIIELLDANYYCLYYSLELLSRSNGNNLNGNIPIPSPHDYFFNYINDNSFMNSLLTTFVRDNFSSDGIAKLNRVWGINLLQPTSISPNSFRNNPLQQLHFSRWRESLLLLRHLEEKKVSNAIFDDVTKLLPLCQQAPIEAGVSSGHTMKGRDPLFPSALRSWNDSCRLWACRLYAFATPSSQAIQKLVQQSPLIEIGAGTGYWSSLVRKAGGVIHTYDKDPPAPKGKGNSKLNSYHGKSKQWTSVESGGPEKITFHSNNNITTNINKQQSNNNSSSSSKKLALFLCYPPPDNDMSVVCLRLFQGDTICYVGEWQGNTGTKAFEKNLSTAFQCTEIIPLPNWGDTCYSLTIWKRRPTTTSNPPSNQNDHVVHPFRCSQCGAGKKQVYRCRLSYNVYFCDQVCATAGRLLHKDELTDKGFIRVGHSEDYVVDQSDDDGDSEQRHKRQQLGESSAEQVDKPLINIGVAYFQSVYAPPVSL